jgi:predicted tellurium resistance membrane protein TerC
VEVFLLWLDEVDDVAFVLASLCHRLRRLCLQVGLLAALTLVGVELALEAPRSAEALASIAGASVALWFLVALAFLAQRLDRGARLARLKITGYRLT